jgi:hypothetical protein
MTNEETGRIIEKVALLTKLINERRGEIADLEIQLGRVQNLCEHAGVIMYRGSRTGTCKTCGMQFMTHMEIDVKFSG